uniref:Annexin ANNAT3 n=1 Tax=Solanum lycopersicum TaxID=4081 RepID=A0A3Q7EIH6_SOLLC
MGHRDASQRKKIKEAYQQLYNKSLMDDLHSELSVILWTYDPPERDARLANEVLQSWIHDVNCLQVIVEIACASTPDHLVAVRQTYCALFSCSLEEDIIARVSLPVQKVNVLPYNKELVDHNTSDELVMILSTRNIHYNFPLQDITNCGEGLLESMLKVVIWCINSPEKHFGLGTNEDSLSRAIVTRAEIDMIKVKEEYLKMKDTALEYATANDTSGYYREFLMTLLGANNSSL